MKMNVKLLRKVQKHILAEPKRLYMSEGLLRGRPGEVKETSWGGVSYGEPDNVVLPACGTVGCIAGWTCVLGKPKRTPRQWNTIRGTAFRLLGLSGKRDSSNYYDPGSILFRVEEWPGKFRRKYIGAKTNRQRAKIAAARIDHFIATKGTE